MVGEAKEGEQVVRDERYEQILAESKLIWGTWHTREAIATLAKSGFHVLRLVRRLEVRRATELAPELFRFQQCSYPA